MNEEKKLVITDFKGDKVTLIPELAVIVVPDFMGAKQHNICINLYTEGPWCYEAYATLTVNFGEFIGAKNCAYIDTNNCPFADQLLAYGIAVDTGLTKKSGFCVYPLWRFNDDFLKEVNEKIYELYSEAFEEYMEAYI